LVEALEEHMRGQCNADLMEWANPTKNDLLDRYME
jgi:hypothetical protein